MPISRFVRTLSAAIAIFLSGAGLATAAAALSSAERPDIPAVVTLGKVTTSPEQARRVLGPLAAHVARYLEDLGVKGIRLLFTRSNEEMLAHLRAGRVDWITETASAASAFVDAKDAEILARRWQQGAPEYQTIIVARRDSDILNVSDLAGKTIAFESPVSVPGYFIPAHAILQAGLSLTRIT